MNEESKLNSTTEFDQDQRKEFILQNLRWQVIILAVNFVIPLKFILYSDPWIDGIVGYLSNSGIGVVVAGLIFLFFTKSSKGKFFRNQRIISLIISLLIVVTSWGRYSY